MQSAQARTVLHSGKTAISEAMVAFMPSPTDPIAVSVKLGCE